jgi:hypothetical protein
MSGRVGTKLLTLVRYVEDRFDCLHLCLHLVVLSIAPFGVEMLIQSIPLIL